MTVAKSEIVSFRIFSLSLLVFVPAGKVMVNVLPDRDTAAPGTSSSTAVRAFSVLACSGSTLKNALAVMLLPVSGMMKVATLLTSSATVYVTSLLSASLTSQRSSI